MVDKLEEDNLVLDDKVIKRSKIKKILIIIFIILNLFIIGATAYYIIEDQKTMFENNQTIDSNIYKKITKATKKEKNSSTN